MKTLFEFEFANDHYLLQSNNWGKEILQRNGQPISVKRNLRYHNEHHFDCPNLGSLRLAFRVDTDAIQTQYSLWAGEQCLLSDSQSALHHLPEFIRKHYQPTADSNAQAADGPAPALDAATQMTASQPGEASQAKPTTNKSIGTWITVGGTLLKLSKSAGARHYVAVAHGFFR